METKVSKGLNETAVAQATTMNAVAKTTKKFVKDDLTGELIDITTAPSRPEQGTPTMSGFGLHMNEEDETRRGRFSQHPTIPGIWRQVYGKTGSTKTKVGWFINLGMDYHAKDDVFLEIATEIHYDYNAKPSEFVGIDGITDKEKIAHISEVGLAKAYEDGTVKHLTESQIYAYSVLYDRASFYWLLENAGKKTEKCA